MRRITFAVMRGIAPPIFVSRGGETTVLTAQPTDAQYDARPYGNRFVEGTGSRRHPFTYRSAAPVSPHYCIVDLWFRFHRRGRPVFIEANDWVLRVEQAGVRAENNQFTRLLPL